MKLTVIIPCYNFESYIERAILSAVSQKTNFEFEILVRDDFSSDSSQICIERVANFNKCVKFFKPDSNLGASNNIRFLMKRARGEYIAYLDGDDYWTDVNKLQKQVDYMDNKPDCVMTFTGYWMRSGTNYSPNLPYQWLGLPVHMDNVIKTEDLLSENYVTFGRVFRNVKIDYKDEELNSIYFDWSTSYELSKTGKIEYLDFPSGVYREHKNGIFAGKEISYRDKTANDLRSFLEVDYESYKVASTLHHIDVNNELTTHTASPMVSFVVPAYLFSEYITDCIDSILSQRVNFDIEILIRDDYSGDNTNEILHNKYSGDKRVCIFHSTENLGVFGNIKFLIANARGKYIAYLDGDDYYTDNDKIQNQIDFLENNPDYIMHSTGNRILSDDGQISPDDERWIIPLHKEPKTSDLIRANVVNFGRVFRNVDNIMHDWMNKTSYLDWVINFELSLRGKIYCDDICTGIYRISGGGLFSMKSEEEKRLENTKVKKLLMERLRQKNGIKKITIIDCFIRNGSIEEKLRSSIQKIKSRGEDVMVISNTPADKSIIEMCDFYFYDNRNQLFQQEYTNVEDVDFWGATGEFVAHNIKPGLQRHGLSVLINLFNVLNIARTLGYTHFQRLECDDIFGPKSLDSMLHIEGECLLNGKRGLFYFNDDDIDRNISFHYFFCEIDYFLNKVERIENEEDYVRYLINNHGNRDFVIAERYIYENLKRNGCEEIVYRDGKTDIDADFSDTIWNTETSTSNVSEKYRGCLTELYNKYASDGSHTGISVYSYNYTDYERKRKIKIKLDNLEEYHIEQHLNCKGAWVFDNVPDNVIEIVVYENEELLYTQKISEIKSYLKWD